MAAKLLGEGLTLEDTADGIRVTEVYRVGSDDITGATTAAQMNNALSVSGVPALGAAWPEDASVVVVNRSVSPVAGETVLDVRVDYETPSSDSDNPLIDTTGVPRFRSGVVEDQTWFDKDGNYMFLLYHGTVQDFWPDTFFTGAGNFGTPANPVNQLVQAEVMRPQFGFELTKRWLGASGYSTALGHATSYIGRVNSSQWNGTINLAPRTALCTDVELEVVNSGEYHARYSFEYRPETWDFVGVYKIWGRPPENLNTPPGNGTSAFEVYDSAEFNSLPVNL